MNKQKKKKTSSQIQTTDCWLPEQKESGGEGEMGKDGQIYGDG